VGSEVVCGVCAGPGGVVCGFPSAGVGKWTFITLVLDSFYWLDFWQYRCGYHYKYISCFVRPTAMCCK